MPDPKQSSLFNTEPDPWQLDDQDDWLAARIVFAAPPFGPYDYSIPTDLESSVKKGVRVVVPLGCGNRTMTGYCIDIMTPSHPDAASVKPNRLKPISRVLDAKPLLDNKLLKLSHQISDYYISQLGTVIETVVPVGARENSGTREMLFLSVDPDVARDLDSVKLTPLQRNILEVMLASNQDWTPGELAETVGCTQGPISTLRRKGHILSSTRRVQQKTHEIQPEARMENLVLNVEQQTALDAITKSIDAEQHKTFLVHGITGSGKTEVYIRAIQQVVEYGRQAIVLVPEISLTPQTRRRFRARFDRVAVLHSHLTSVQRAWHWRQIAEGNVQVIIGARSAVFAPTPRLGLIVLDEEHDASFKQDNTPRYHARDVAQWRAESDNVPLLLGSATPSLESWHKAQTGQFETLSLKNRVLDLPLPDVATIDLRTDAAGMKRRFSPIHQKLRQEMTAALNDGGQVILLLNRRGFSTRIQCPSCGKVEYCPDCSIPLTHHVEGKKAICHYCDHTIPEPRRCSDCGNDAIRFSGLGTQKLEAEVRTLFPDVEIMRMDTDTMRKRGSHEKALSKFRDGETKILLGTQMIAKGLDFPNVTLVGVVNADTSLHLPDFRSAERTFGLVTQVAGRTGRGERGGRVLVQTFSPENPAIICATRHDYVNFASGELPVREEFNYPPFGKLARIVVRGEIQAQVEQMAEHIAECINQATDELELQLSLLGPSVAPLEKLRGNYRFHMLLGSVEQNTIQRVVKRAQTKIKNMDDIQWIVDVDPYNMV